ncbi:hypothetical protein MDAP_002327 [Mitosporidium daphniae]|uniref:DUF1000-domain-containing protein n=1 Tax=Mitosporidium daphniae TaxID=1485682 RepID=A0A098VRP9_9MICR|nr:DUF1000-domain-containing protein [Mitosporidium daphniae]KGG51733.1 DUF1000-domain-containing protein [Mitosporidium daphniae]|eukprot:XP_013238161.1 DUF1000-domain-containing protein [Mitosporidium daphniae]
MPCNCSSSGSSDCCIEESSTGGANCSPSAASLFKYIDHANIYALNEKTRDSVKGIFRPHHLRLQTDMVVQSDDDDSQLIIRIPLSQSIKLSFIAIGMLQPGPEYVLRIFANGGAGAGADFSNIWTIPVTQEIALADTPSIVTTYPLQRNKFSNVDDLVLHICTADHGKNTPFPARPSSSPLFIFYAGLYGETTLLRRDPVIGVYEARPIASDHPCVSVKHQPVPDSFA